MIKNFFKTFDWINFLKIILSIIFLFYINFYLVNSYILTGGTNQLPIPFQTSLTFGFVAYLFSIIGISFYLIKDLNKLFLIKVISGYLIYQVISYFLLVTRNLNNREFKTWDFANNHFFQTNFLPTFLIILSISIVLSFIIKKSKYLTFIENYLEKFDSKEVLLSGILSSFIVNDRQMLKIFKELVLSFLSNDDYVQFMTHLSSNLFLSLVIMGIISYLVLNSYQGIATNTPTPSVMVTVSLLLAIIFNYTLQLGVRSDEALLGNFIFPGATAYQIIVLTLLFLVIYLVLNRFLSATLFIIVVGVIISVVNNIKEGLRSEPLLITDFVWTKQLTKSVMETPDGYSEERIEEIAKKYRQEASVINVSRANNIADQTVIFILSESFADPSRVPGVTLSENPIPNITQIKAEYTSGLMISDFYGGGTANMEMQALLGIPYSNLSSSVSSFTTEVIPKMLYLPSISNNFNDEDKYIVHLDNAKNYSRNTVYERMHFDTFIAESGSDYKPKKVVINDGNASDTSSYNVILDYLNTSKNQFFQLITIQNHLPWGKDEPANLNGYGMGFTDVENTILSRYTRDLRDTDYMTANFLEELSKVNKKITVVFYGDHLPGLYPDKIFANNNSKYETDYFIWSNFETEKLNYPLVTSSNFPALLLDVTNSKVSPYYALLTKVLDESVLVDKALTKEQEEIKKELAIIQYDITLGKGYIMKKDKSFFELDGD